MTPIKVLSTSIGGLGDANHRNSQKCSQLQCLEVLHLESSFESRSQRSRAEAAYATHVVTQNSLELGFDHETQGWRNIPETGS